MNQWSLSIQQMIDWIEQNIENNPTLLQMSAQVGYSPHYCSFLFHKVCGIIESMRHIALESTGCHLAGWFYENGKKGYFYGFGIPTDYSGVVPEGFEIRDVPASNYLVFFHPQFDFLAENNEVMRKVENLAWNYDPSKPDSDRLWIPGGYEWNEGECPDYQRHFPEVWGYEVLRPVRKK